jgi:putative hydrolase of the HAD superfamily
MNYEAVIFDIGGVVVGSPLHAIADYERASGIPAGTINRIIVATGAAGAWARLERGELTTEEFFPVFDRECAAGGCTLSGRAMMAAMAEATVPRPAMLEAIRRIRGSGRKTAALTNNWKAGEPDVGALSPHFDVVVESAVEGVRKPDPKIYELTCSRLDVPANTAVFLDDIGANLKTARALGMTTIKVVEPGAALAELEGLLGLALRG